MLAATWRSSVRNSASQSAAEPSSRVPHSVMTPIRTIRRVSTPVRDRGCATSSTAGVSSRVVDVPPHDDDRAQPRGQDGGDREVPRKGYAGPRRERAERGADAEPDAPAGVVARHVVAPEPTVDVGALDVDRDVPRAEPDPEREQGDGRGHHAGSQPGGDQPRCGDHRGDDDHRAAAEPVRDPAHEGHRDERAEPDHQQNQTQGPGVGVEAVTGRRDPRDPRRDQRGVEPVRDRAGDRLRPGHLAAAAGHRALRRHPSILACDPCPGGRAASGYADLSGTGRPRPRARHAPRPVPTRPSGRAGGTPGARPPWSTA